MGQWKRKKEEKKRERQRQKNASKLEVFEDDSLQEQQINAQKGEAVEGEKDNEEERGKPDLDIFTFSLFLLRHPHVT